MSGRAISVAPGPPDAKIGAIAKAQRTCVAREQLIQAGVAPSAIDRRLRSRRLIRKHPGVYVDGYAAPVELADETAALLACGPTAMLSHHSGATLYSLRPGIARPIHLVVPDEGFGTRELNGVIVHRSRILEPRDIRIHNGLPVTSPARVMLDLAATLPERDLGYILEEGLRKRLLREADIAELLARAGRHPGVHMLSRLMAHRTGSFTESHAQRRLLELIRNAGLPLPETEVPLLGYRADLFWRDAKLVVDVDGYQAHGTRAAIERDHRRDADMRLAGYTVIRITAREIEYEPLAVIALLAQMIGSSLRVEP